MNKKDMMPFHLFHHHGNHYVINIERMQANPVDDTTAKALEKMVTETETLLPLGIEQNLRKLGLIADHREKKENIVKEEPVPIVYLYLFLTQSCNLRCIYCYGDGGEYGTGGSMEEKTAFQAVDWFIKQAGEMKKIHLGFFGGEPLLKFPLMKAVVEYAKKRAADMGKDIDFYFATNATLLNDEIITFIKEGQISVMISFDGPQEVQDAQRPYANGQGSYNSVVPRIKKLLAAVPETSGHAVLMGNTDPQSVKDAMQEIGFAKVSISPATPSLSSIDPNNRQPARDTQTLLQRLEQEAETWLHLIQSRDSETLKILKARSALYGIYRGMASLLHNTKRHHFCGAGRGLVGVSVSGDVYLCHRFVGWEGYKLGSVFENNLNRKEYLKSPITCNQICANCLARYYCAGGCKHDNLNCCGSIAAPSEDMCRLRCRELELAAMIVCSLGPEDRAFLVDEQIFTPKPCPLDF